MIHATPDPELQSHMQQLDELLQEIDSIADRGTRDKVAQIIQTLMEFHGAGLSSILRRVAQAGDAGAAVMKDLTADELVASLLLLYGLHPQDLESRVRAALEKVRPALSSHKGDVELVEITADGVVVLQMRGNCHGCPSSAATMKSTIEKAIYEIAPDVSSIRVEGEEAPPAVHPAGFVPVELLIAGSKRVPLPQGAV